MDQVIPNLPKPKSSVSPKLSRTVTTQPPLEVKPSNGSADLLGLDTSIPETKTTNNDDIFSSFFSAAAPEPPPVVSKIEGTDLKTEEENFFNQPAPTEKEKSKLTKDSILALYSQTPATNLVNQPHNQFNSQPNTFYSNFQGMPAQNGMQQQYNQFPPISGQFGSAMPQQQGFGQSFAQPQMVSQPAPAQPLPQQFGNLNLGQTFPSFTQQTSNMSGNLSWQ